MDEPNKTPPAPEPPAPEPPAPEPPAPEPPAPEPSYAEALNAVKVEYEKKIAALNVAHSQELNERDEIIKQLITGNETGTNKPQTIADKINQARNFKKW